MLIGNLVRLRPYEMTDLDRITAWINDPEVTMYLAGPLRFPRSRESEEEWLRAAVTRTKPPSIVLAIDTLAESRHIGSIGLHDVSADDRKATLGILIGDKAYWDHGYGTDTIRTFLRFAFDEINLNRVDLHVDADNLRAIACYRKCGFQQEGCLRQDCYRGGHYVDTLVMGILALEFQALRRSL